MKTAFYARTFQNTCIYTDSLNKERASVWTINRRVGGGLKSLPELKLISSEIFPSNLCSLTNSTTTSTVLSSASPSSVLQALARFALLPAPPPGNTRAFSVLGSSVWIDLILGFKSTSAHNWPFHTLTWLLVLHCQQSA